MSILENNNAQAQNLIDHVISWWLAGNTEQATEIYMQKHELYPTQFATSYISEIVAEVFTNEYAKLESQPPHTRKSVLSYITTMLWASVGDDGEPLDCHYSYTDLHPSAMHHCIADWQTFNEECARQDCADFTEYAEAGRRTIADEIAAHDLWLTRCGHGAGFWDGDYIEPYAARLTTIAETMGNLDPYIGDDGLIYLQ